MEGNYSKILMVGDLHGDDSFTSRVFKRASERKAEVILQLGDFGYWPHMGAYHKWVSKCVQNYGIPLYWLGGNHENYDAVGTLAPQEDGTFEIAPGVFYLPRGYTWDWSNKKFLSCGGAVSIDRESRIMGKSWWPQEMISLGDVERSMSAGKVDYFVSHECPFTEISDIDPRYNDRWLPPEISLDSRQQRRSIGAIVNYCEPDEMFHGHHHVRYDKDYVSPDGHLTKVHGMGANIPWGNIDNATYLLTLPVEAGTLEEK